MSVLPIMYKPYDDELLYSWVCRLAMLNGIPFEKFYEHFFRMCKMQNDCRRNYYAFADSFATAMDIAELFLKTSTLPFDIIGMSEGYQTRAVYGAFYPKNRINAREMQCFKSFVVCPECVRGCSFYFRRSHHLKGVKVCYKHHCKLVAVDRSFTGMEHLDVDESVLDELDVEYAEFANKVLQACLNINIRMVSRLIFEKFKVSGRISTEAVNDFEASKYSKMLHRDLRNYLKILGTTKKTPVTDIMPLLLYCYGGNGDEFISDCRKIIEPISNFDGYFTFSSENMIVKSYIHKTCGTIFGQTEWGMRNGIRCPNCCNDAVEVLVNKLVSRVEDGNYTMLLPFSGMAKNLVLRHKACGSVFTVRPSTFIFGESRCLCMHKVNLKKLKDSVERSGDFTLVKSYGSKSCVIRHIACGREFTSGVSSFLANPVCRYCRDDDKNKEYKNKVTELVGDEYSIISTEIRAEKPVEFQHNICGAKFRCKIFKFLTGTRCPVCSSVVTAKELKRITDIYTNGRYGLLRCDGAYAYVRDNYLGREIRLHRLEVMQELLRITPSEILELDGESESKRMTMVHNREIERLPHSLNDGFYRYLKGVYGADDFIFLEDIEYTGGDVAKLLAYLCNQGKLIRVYSGIYVFTEKGSVTPEEIIKAKFVERNNKILGYYSLDNPRRIYTTIYEGKGHYEIKVDGIRFYVKACRVRDLTRRMALFLPVLDMLSYQSEGFDKKVSLASEVLKENGVEYAELEPFIDFYTGATRRRLQTLYAKMREKDSVF